MKKIAILALAGFVMAAGADAQMTNGNSTQPSASGQSNGTMTQPTSRSRRTRRTPRSSSGTMSNGSMSNGTMSNGTMSNGTSTPGSMPPDSMGNITAPQR